MKAKHTSGQWAADGRHVRIPVYNEQAGCELLTLMLEKEEGEAKANAKLIAAAPELLRALEDLTSQINLSSLNIKKDFSLINAHAQALKIIHKATT